MEGLRNNKLAEDLLHLALVQGASDLHIEPDGQGVRVRIRVDGLLQQLCVLPHSQQSTLLTQLKVWSGMDIAEKRVPQDGRLLQCCALVAIAVGGAYGIIYVVVVGNGELAALTSCYDDVACIVCVDRISGRGINVEQHHRSVSHVVAP